MIATSVSAQSDIERAGHIMVDDLMSPVSMIVNRAVSADVGLIHRRTRDYAEEFRGAHECQR